MAAAQHVQVEMIDGLAAVGAGVDHHAIAVGEAFRARNISRRNEQVAEQGSVITGAVGERRDVLARHHEEVRGRLRVNVGERNAFLVLVNELRGNGSSDDLAEKAIHNGISLQERFCEEDNFAVS